MKVACLTPLPGTQAAAEIEAKRIVAIRAMEDWLYASKLTSLQQVMSPVAEQQLMNYPYPTYEITGSPVLEDDPFPCPVPATAPFPIHSNPGAELSFGPAIHSAPESIHYYPAESASVAAPFTPFQFQQRRNHITSLIDEQQQYFQTVRTTGGMDNEETYLMMKSSRAAQPEQGLVQNFKSETRTIIGKALEKKFGDHADPDVAFVLDVKRLCVDEPMSASEYSRSVLRQGVSCKKIIVAVMMYWKGQFPNRDIMRWKSAVERARLQLNNVIK